MKGRSCWHVGQVKPTIPDHHRGIMGQYWPELPQRYAHQL